MSSTEHDRGLHAVARVREVRERDGRLGLMHADREHRAALLRADQLDTMVRSHATALDSPTGSITAAEWAAGRVVLGTVAASARRTHLEADTAALVRTAAQEHWQHARSRVRAVEALLERRADARRAEAARAEARLLDDLGAQRWLRARTTTEAGR